MGGRGPRTKGSQVPKGLHRHIQEAIILLSCHRPCDMLCYVGGWVVDRRAVCEDSAKVPKKGGEDTPIRLERPLPLVVGEATKGG